MKTLKMFKTNETPLNQIYGGGKVKTTGHDEKSGKLTIHTEDGFYDENGDGLQQCGETGYKTETWKEKC